MRPDHFAPDPSAKVEPTAAARRFAANIHDNFAALVQSGFTESQALQILGYAVTAILQNPNQ